MKKFTISSGAFGQGESIPEEYTCDGIDISPPLVLSGIPEGAKSIAIVMDDPDAPGRTFVHWVIYNIPAGTQQIAEAVPVKDVLADGSRQGKSDFGRTGYGGHRARPRESCTGFISRHMHLTPFLTCSQALPNSSLKKQWIGTYWQKPSLWDATEDKTRDIYIFIIY